MKDNEPGSARPHRRAQLFAFGFEAAVGIAALLAAWVFSVPIGPTITLDIESILASAAGIAALFLVFLVASRSKAAPFRRIRTKLDSVLGVFFGGAPVRTLLAISLVAGVSEELFFRAVLQQGLAVHVGPWTAALLTNLVFALAHLITPMYGVVAFLMGMILSAVFLVSDSLIAAAITHGLYDFFALLYYRRRP